MKKDEKKDEKKDQKKDQEKDEKKTKKIKIGLASPTTHSSLHILFYINQKLKYNLAYPLLFASDVVDFHPQQQPANAIIIQPSLQPFHVIEESYTIPSFPKQ